MRADHAAVSRIFLTLTIGHMQLELNVVSNIAVLPHEELDG